MSETSPDWDDVGTIGHVLAEPVNPDEYNGWPNRETWVLDLHLSNDEGLYNLVTEWAQEAWDEAQDAEIDPPSLAASILATQIEDAVEDWSQDLIEAATDGVGGLNRTIAYLIVEVGSWWRCDFRAVAAGYIEEASA